MRSLEFEEQPDYGYLKKLLYNIFIKKNFQENFHFDWELDNCQKKKYEGFTNFHGSDKKLDSIWPNEIKMGTMNTKFINRPTNHQSIKFDNLPINIKNNIQGSIALNEVNRFNFKKNEENDDLQIPSENVKVMNIKLSDYVQNQMHFYKYKNNHKVKYYKNNSECFGENFENKLEKSNIFKKNLKKISIFSPKSECLPQDDGKFKF